MTFYPIVVIRCDSFLQEALPNRRSFAASGVAAEVFDTWAEGDCASAAAPGDAVRVDLLRVWSAECVLGIQARMP